ncbi:hypothetical protein [Haliangium sp.]|uniref:hypothetical protein n=1 Tax=Haliangium sp. TaxID=2663208 RepID=UPI003D10013D
MFDTVLRTPQNGPWFVLIRCHGKDGAASVVELLADFDMLLRSVPAGSLKIDRYAAAFLFDADAAGVDATLTEFRDRYRGHFGDLDQVGHGSWISSATHGVPVGCFVFHDPTTSTGSLEDHLIPMVRKQWPTRTSAAEQYFDTHIEADDPVSASPAQRWKAVITTVSQFHHPGSAMSRVLHRDRLPRKHFQASAAARELATFLTSVPW